MGQIVLVVYLMQYCPVDSYYMHQTQLVNYFALFELLPCFSCFCQAPFDNQPYFGDLFLLFYLFFADCNFRYWSTMVLEK